jgi:hypothetical protein
MTDSFTLCCKSSLLKAALCLFAWLFFAGGVAHAQVPTEVSQLRVERTDEELQLSAQLQFEISSAVEEALVKGIPMVFVISADVVKERWYWYDKKLAAAERFMRLAYQPLTRRWRLNVSSGPAVNSGVGLALNQSFDTLAQALSAIKRIAKWKIAETADVDTSGKYKLDFRFKLDLSQLPRPFQIGALGQSDWDVSANVLMPLSVESAK